MHNRIKEIRKKAGLSQVNFGAKLGVSRDVVNNIENGRVEPKPLIVKHICSVFGISEQWLLTGEGSKEAPNQIDSVVELLKSTFDNLDSYDKQVITVWLKATPEDRAAIKRCFDSLKALQEEESAQSELSATIVVRPARNDKDVTREEVHRMIDQEFDAKEKGQTSSVSTISNGLGEKLA